MNSFEPGGIPAIETDPETWIDLLVDNQLNATQRRELLAFFSKHPEHWERCALRFIDEQFLNETLNAGRSFTNDEGKESNQESGRSSSEAGKNQTNFGSRALAVKTGNSRLPVETSVARTGIGIAIAASIIFLMGWGASRMLFSSSANDLEQQVALKRQLNSIAATYEEVYELAAEGEKLEAQRDQQRQMDAIRTLARGQMMIEVENNEESATYYSHGAVPDFLLEALVWAGHRVEVKQKLVEVQRQHGDTFEYPIHQVDIEKYALLKFANEERTENVD